MEIGGSASHSRHSASNVAMSFLDILHLALRNLRQAKLRATLTTMGVIVGVAVIVTMVSFGLGLQGNMFARFKALDLFNEIQVFGQGLSNLAGLEGRRRDEGDRRNDRQRADKTPVSYTHLTLPTIYSV